MTSQHSIPIAPLSALEERRWVGLAHLSGLLSFVGPLIVWLVYRDRSDAVERQSKEALNAQITLAGLALVLYVVGGALSLIVVGVVFLVAAPIVQLLGLIFAIVGALETRSADTYRYPFALRLIQ
jgi:uncharacterized Tic20 family protein